MPDSPADYFPADFASSQATDERPTPPAMGGARPVLPPALRGPTPRPTDPATRAADRALLDRTDTTIPIAGAGIVPASGVLVIDCGGPLPGYVWDVKALHVGPRDYSALPYPGGVTVLAFTRAQGAAADLSATDLLDYSTTYPAHGFWGRGEATVEQRQNVQVVVLGLPAGTVVTVGGTAYQTAVAVAERRSLG